MNLNEALFNLRYFLFFITFTLLYNQGIAQSLGYRSCTLEEFMNNCNNLPSIKEKNSLVKIINESSSIFPNDLSKYTLILEDYNLSDYLKSREVKFCSAITPDMADSMLLSNIIRNSPDKRFSGYIDNTTCRWYVVDQFLDSANLLKDKVTVIGERKIPKNLNYEYHKKSSYHNLPISEFRYVLRSIWILSYDEEKFQLLNGEIPVPYRYSPYLYLFDRQEKKYFGMLKEKKYLKELNKHLKNN